MPDASLDASHVLDLVPAPNRAVREVAHAGSLILYAPIEQTWWLRLLAWILPVRRERGFALDKLGEEVWRACDGEQTVERIVERFAERHRVRFQEARQSVLVFLKMLAEKNLIAMLLSHDQESP